MISKKVRSICAKTMGLVMILSLMSTTLHRPSNVLAEENINIGYEERVPIGVVLDRSEAIIEVGNTKNLTANVLPQDSSNKTIVWSSSNEEVATVDENGRVFAIAEGEANITSTTEIGGYSASCDVKVRGKYNIISNGSFELGTNGWQGTRQANIAINNYDSIVGKNSLYVSNRKETGAGPIQEVTGKMKQGITYDISFYVKYDKGPDVKEFNCTMEMPDFKYQILITGEAKKGEWSKIQGKYEVTEDLSKYDFVNIFIETPWKVIQDPVEDLMDFQVDDIQVLGGEIQQPVIKINNITNNSVYNRKAVIPDIYVDDSEAVVNMILNGESYDGSPITEPGDYELVITADNGKITTASVKFKITNEYPKYSNTEINNPIVTYRYTADPAVMIYNGRFYVYTSSDSQYGGNDFNDLDVTVCLSSDDMVNWKYEGDVFRAKEDSPWATMAWAPSAIERDGKFYLYFANGGGGIGVAVSDSPTGPFIDAIGKPLVSSNADLNTNVPWIFDPAAFIDDDGQAYLYFGGHPSEEGEECNARVIKLKDNMVEIEGKAVTIEIPEFFEALWMNKIGDKYYLSYSSSYATTSPRIDYMVSDNPMSGFEYKYGVENRTILDNPPNNNWGNNHASITEFEGKWYIIYHSKTLAIQNGVAGDSRRSVAVDYMEFNEDGSIKKVTPTTNGVDQIKGFDPYRNGNRSVISRQFGLILKEGSDRQKYIVASNDSWLQIKGVDFSQGTTEFEARVASLEVGGKIELRIDSLDGEVIGALNVDQTTGVEDWSKQSVEVSNVKGTHDLYMLFSSEDEKVFNLADWKFTGSSSEEVPPTEINKLPVITASDVTLTIGSEFNPLKNVTAEDDEDGDITNKIEIIENTVDTTKVGEYKVVYKVSDSKGAAVTKGVVVNVIDKENVETEVKVSGVSLDKKEVTMKVNETLVLKATVNPDNASNKNVIWISSNEKVAKVDKDGKVIALSKGNAVITVKTRDGEFIDTCKVTVNNKNTNVSGNKPNKPLGTLPQTGNGNCLMTIVFAIVLISIGKFIVVRKGKVLE